MDKNAKLSPVQQKFILHWGEMGTKWGINRTVAQIHALLFISPEPLTAEEIGKIVDQVIAANPKSVEEYKSGKEKAFNALVGQVMKATRGKANPAQVNEILRRKLA